MFEKLLDKHEPKLSAHMERIGAVPSLISMQWIMTLLTMGFPRELVLIAWDNIFYERTPRFLLMLLLAVMRLHRVCMSVFVWLFASSSSSFRVFARELPF
jgi:Rab-GTPase-TBC domain